MVWPTTAPGPRVEERTLPPALALIALTVLMPTLRDTEAALEVIETFEVTVEKLQP
jgi:hypothetical protein